MDPVDILLPEIHLALRLRMRHRPDPWFQSEVSVYGQIRTPDGVYQAENHARQDLAAEYLDRMVEATVSALLGPVNRAVTQRLQDEYLRGVHEGRWR